MLLIAPVTLLVCERLGVSPVPFLIAEIMAGNVGGTATLIGDPPDIIIAGRAGLSFNDFLVDLAPFIVVLLGVFLVLAWALFRRGMRYDPERAARVMALNEREAIGDRPLLVKSLVVVALVLTGFLTAGWTGMERSRTSVAWVRDTSPPRFVTLTDLLGGVASADVG